MHRGTGGSVYEIDKRLTSPPPIGRITLGTFAGAKGTMVSMKAYTLKSIWPENVDTLSYRPKKTDER